MTWVHTKFIYWELSLSLSFFIPKAFRIMMAHKNEINSFWKEIPFKVKLHFPGSENILKLNDGVIYMYVCVCIIYTPSWTNIINKIIWSFICQRKNFHSNVYFYSRCWNEIKRDRFSKMVSRVFTNRKLLNFRFFVKAVVQQLRLLWRSTAFHFNLQQGIVNPYSISSPSCLLVANPIFDFVCVSLTHSQLFLFCIYSLFCSHLIVCFCILYAYCCATIYSHHEILLNSFDVISIQAVALCPDFVSKLKLVDENESKIHKDNPVKRK